MQQGAASSWTLGDRASALGRSSTSLGEINDIVLAFLRHETEAAVAHFTALTEVRSAGDLLRLQAGEIQRAADASLSCLGSILRSVSRVVTLRRP